MTQQACVAGLGNASLYLGKSLLPPNHFTPAGHTSAHTHPRLGTQMTRAVLCAGDKAVRCGASSATVHDHVCAWGAALLSGGGRRSCRAAAAGRHAKPAALHPRRLLHREGGLGQRSDPPACHTRVHHNLLWCALGLGALAHDIGGGICCPACCLWAWGCGLLTMSRHRAGYPELLKLLAEHKQSGGEALDFNIFGSGADMPAIKARAEADRSGIHFHDGVDHLDEQLRPFRCAAEPCSHLTPGAGLAYALAAFISRSSEHAPAAPEPYLHK